MFYCEQLLLLLRTLEDMTANWEEYPLPRPNPTLALYEEFQLFLLEVCDSSGYSRSTKFLAKTYFDMAISCLPRVEPERVKLYMLTALNLAIKFNESRLLSERAHQQIYELITEEYQPIDFVQAEIEMLMSVPSMPMHLASPYDYAALFQQLALQSHGHTFHQQQLDSTLNIAISLPALSLQSAKLIFLGCLLHVSRDAMGSEGLRGFWQGCPQELWTDANKVQVVLEIYLGEVLGSRTQHTDK